VISTSSCGRTIIFNNGSVGLSAIAWTRCLATQCDSRAQALAAQAFGARHTFFVTTALQRATGDSCSSWWGRAARVLLIRRAISQCITRGPVRREPWYLCCLMKRSFRVLWARCRQARLCFARSMRNRMPDSWCSPAAPNTVSLITLSRLSRRTRFGDQGAGR